jgi:DUF4097 and DUF4098 domain-containing protein YvlB
MERFYRTIERRFDTGSEVRLEIDCRNGDVVVQHHDLPEVRVVAVVESDAESMNDAERDFRAIEDGMRFDNGRVRVSAPVSERQTFLFFGRGLKVNYQVTTPVNTQLRLEARNGRTEVYGIAGDATIEDRNGSVLLERMGGSVNVEARNGRIDANDCAGDLSVVSRNGHVHVARPGGNLSAETRNGNVVVRDARGQNTRMRSSNGTLTYAGSVAGNIDMEVEDNGPIRIGVPSDSRFILDAEAVRGDIKSDLPVKDNPPSEAPRPTVRLRTVNGSIKIETLAGAAS